MKSDWSKKWILLITVFLALKVILFPPYELQLRSEEPRRAVISMEMIFSGDYIHPQLCGWSYYNKPPLFNWVLVFFMKLSGSFSESIVRLPGLLSHLILSIGIYFFTRKYLDDTTALLSSLFYLTAGEILFYGAVIAGQIDLFFSLLVFIQITSLFRGLVEKKRRYFLISYLFLGLGILTKGIPSIAFQFLTIGVWYIATRETLGKWSIKSHLYGSLITVLLVGLYFMIYQLKGGDAAIYLINLFYEAASKSGLEADRSDLLKNLFAFPGAFIKLLLPWIFLLLLWVLPTMRKSILEKPILKYSLIFILSNILLYWFSGYITTRYLFPFVPFLAILAAGTFSVGIKQHREGLIKYLYYFILVLLLSGPILILVYILSKQGVHISYGLLKLGVSILISVGGILVFRRYPHHRMILSILSVLILKWYTQWTYYPSRYADERINSLIAHIPHLFEYSAGEPIYLLGSPEEHRVDVSLANWSIVSTTFRDPMPLSYQLPYYIERTQGSIMEFHTSAVKNVFYLMRKEDIPNYVDPQEIDVLYEFVDDWKRIPLALIKT